MSGLSAAVAQKASKSEVAQLCQLFEILWTVAHQAPPLSMGFSRQEYWSGVPLSTSGDLPDPGIHLLHWRVDSLPLAPPGNPFSDYT